MIAILELLTERQTLAATIAAQIEQLRDIDERLTAATAADPNVKASDVIATIDEQDDLIITALTGIQDEAHAVKCALHPLRETEVARG